MLQRGQTGDGCDLDSTLRKYDLRKGDLLTELGKGATSEAGKYLFRAANVWWRYVQYLVVVVVCHNQVRLQVSQGFRCQDS